MRTVVIDNSRIPFFLREGAVTAQSLPEAVRVVGGVRGRLPQLNEFDRLVITGSEASATADDDWIKRQADFLADAVDAGKAVLGVCFGQQILARALWGKNHVRRATRPEFGWFDLTFEPDPLFADLPPIAPWYCSHYDEVFDLPDTASVIARSERCDVHGFSLVDRPVWGVQFHPEHFGWHGAFLLQVMRLVDRSLDITEKHRVRSTEAATQARRLFANFWRMTS